MRTVAPKQLKPKRSSKKQAKITKALTDRYADASLFLADPSSYDSLLKMDNPDGDQS